MKPKYHIILAPIMLIQASPLTVIKKIPTTYKFPSKSCLWEMFQRIKEQMLIIREQLFLHDFESDWQIRNLKLAKELCEKNIILSREKKVLRDGD
jgi:hypothetical protein